MPWEVFDRTRAPATPDPRVTIQKNGVMTLNIAAADALGNPEAVQLLYDADERRVGFRKVQPGQIGAYTFRRQGKSNTFNVSGQRFSRYYGLDTNATKRYAATLDNGTLAINLDDPIEVFK